MNAAVEGTNAPRCCTSDGAVVCWRRLICAEQANAVRECHGRDAKMCVPSAEPPAASLMFNRARSTNGMKPPAVHCSRGLRACPRNTSA